ncbi:MAG: hypothetical protein CVV05_02240 [Gammaproteobacteria bacterium HGW-Gammaproteobacteria-1]|jgi:hypothetical protein|nr:MAG: hypothetical protein CVV05_02240 [Gammaproteobacteria bacterium HGW-Gammaproteobacteria-1]
MPRINPTLDDIGHCLSGRRVALVGNSERLFESDRQVDGYERVIRINNGHLAGRHHATAGSRTDVLALSLAVDVSEPLFESVGLVMWMTPKHEMITPELAPFLTHYPQAQWDRLYAELGTRPSTGCMMFDFLIRNIGFASLTLLGFDFWRSPTWYTAASRPGPHSPENEERYVRSAIERHRLENRAPIELIE